MGRDLSASLRRGISAWPLAIAMVDYSLRVVGDRLPRLNIIDREFGETRTNAPRFRRTEPDAALRH